MSIVVNLDKLLLRRMTSRELAQKTGITEANLSILKTGKAKAIRFTTLENLCKALDCQPGDLLEYNPERLEVLLIKWCARKDAPFLSLVGYAYPLAIGLISTSTVLASGAEASGASVTNSVSAS